MIELASYVGDVLSYYIDYNYKENILATATEKRNVVRLSEFLGYKVSPNTPSLARLRVTADVGVDANGNPDYSDAPQNPINSGLQIESNVDSNLKFETLGEIDFGITQEGTPDDEIKKISRILKIHKFFKEILGSPKDKIFWCKYLVDKYSLKKKETLFTLMIF